ncbi:MAG: hypothetical protein IKT66_03985 [Alistipes sp.]|nr:hypothetical protein [Alistipes sp.]
MEVAGDKYILKSTNDLNKSQIDRLILLGLPSEIVVYDTHNRTGKGLDYSCMCNYGNNCKCLKDDNCCHRIIAKEIVDEFYVKQIF